MLIHITRRMLLVALDSESKAYEGLRKLDQLNVDGCISMYAYAVVAKNKEGRAAIVDLNSPNGVPLVQKLDDGLRSAPYYHVGGLARIEKAVPSATSRRAIAEIESASNPYWHSRG